jgi:hypothetical protein
MGGPHNITHTAGGARPDFGPDFYTTTWLHQAENWANRPRAADGKVSG